MKKTMNPRGRFDGAYKSLFSNPKVLVQLINNFVDVGLPREIAAGEVERLEKSSFVTPEFLNREADMIYHVRHRERDLYFYILLEFQSVPDKRMPIRLYSYLFLFYEQLIRHRQRGRLPPVFPMVLYNGDKVWRVKHSVQDLIMEGIIPECYVPRGSFFLLDESKVPDEKLKEVNNLAAAVIYYEKHKREEDMESVLLQMLDLLRHEDFSDVKRLLNWVARIGGISFKSEEIEALENIDEGNKMVKSLYEMDVDRKAEKRAAVMAEKLAAEMAAGMAEKMAAGMAEKMASGMAEKMAAGMAEKMASGMAEKMASGMAEKMASGMAEKILKEKLTEPKEQLRSIARSMKAKGFETALIQELTGLNTTEIEGL